MLRTEFPTNNKICQLLGKVDIYFAGLQNIIEFYIWEIVNPADQTMGQAITAEMQFRSIVGLANTVFQHKFGHDVQKVKKFSSLLNRAERMGRERNDYIHAIYGAGNTPNDLARMRNTARNGQGLKHEAVIITESMLEDFIRRISELAGDFHAFMPQVFVFKKVASASDLNLRG